MRIKDYIFFGGMTILLGFILITIKLNYIWEFPLTEIWLGFLFTTVILPTMFFRNSKYVNWLNKKRHIKTKTTEDDRSINGD